MKFCPNCGSKLIKGKNFCAECGEKVTDTPTLSESQQTSLNPLQQPLYNQEIDLPKKKRKAPFVINLVVAGVVFLSAAAMAVLEFTDVINFFGEEKVSETEEKEETEKNDEKNDDVSNENADAIEVPERKIPKSETSVDSNGVTYTYELDKNGNSVRCEGTDGYWRKSEYDENGNMTYFENSDGDRYKYEYDENGNRTYYEDSDTDFWEKCEYNDAGKETHYENSDGYWEKREYDENGNETYYEDSSGYWEKTTYEY